MTISWLRPRPAKCFALCLTLILSSCSATERVPVGEVPPSTSASSSVQAAAPEAPIELGRLGTGSGGKAAARAGIGEIYRGSGQVLNSVGRRSTGATASSDGDISLNFINADVREAAKGVLGDLLGLSYVIDPSVQGTVTIQTSQMLSRKDVLPAFETALRLNGVAVVRQGDYYSLVPYGTAGHLGANTPGGQGYGTEIVQLHYVGAEQMRRVLEPLAPQGTIVQVDQARDLIVIGGTDGERASIRDNIATFDADWLKGMSFALFTPRIATAKQMAEDLTHVMGDENGPMIGQVRLVPIERMNAVLAISSRSEYLEELRTWVARLDQGNVTTDRRIFVYRVQNGRAGDLAEVLGKALGIRSNVGAPQSRPQNGLLTSQFGGMGQTGETAGGPLPATGAAPASSLMGSPSQSVIGTSSGRNGANLSPSGASNEPAGGVSITADNVNNALLVVATPSEYETIESALAKLDILPLQVLIEAAIAEVTLTDDLNFGVQWLFNNDTNRATLSDVGTGAVAGAFPGFSYVYTSGTRITAVLTALQNVTHVDVLSSPKLMVLNNQTAVLKVGDQVPIATQSAVSIVTPGAPVVNSIEYKDTGVILTVTPRVNEGGLVLMDISQEVSNVSSTTSSTLNSPTINQRKIGSTVAIQDGQTVALGGLITDNRSRGRSGVPLLQDIPVLGHLFGQTTKSASRTELLVLITPRVVRDGRAAAAVTTELRNKLTNLRDSPIAARLNPTVGSGR